MIWKVRYAVTFPSNLQLTLSSHELPFQVGQMGEVGLFGFFKLAEQRQVDLSVDKGKVMCLRKLNTAKQ